MTSSNALITAAKNLLVARLPALLAAASETLANPTDWLLHEPLKWQPEAAPYGWIDLVGARRDDSESAGSSIGRSGFYQNHRILAVGFIVSNEDPEAARVAVRAYGDLIRQCITADPSQSPSYFTNAGAQWVQWLQQDDIPAISLGGTLYCCEVQHRFEIPRRTRKGTD